MVLRAKGMPVLDMVDLVTRVLTPTTRTTTTTVHTPELLEHLTRHVLTAIKNTRIEEPHHVTVERTVPRSWETLESWESNESVESTETMKRLPGTV